MSLKDEINKQEPVVDAGITKVQGVLESLKTSPHSTWVLLIFAVILLVMGVWIWVT